MQSVGEACRSVLAAADPRDKVMAARFAARQWRLGRLSAECSVAMPDYPARPDQPELLPPNKMPKRGKGGSERGRIALLHALAHIEFSAIDLAFDLIGRFGGLFPEEFISDWMRVGADEAMHFALLDRRLKQMGSHYGALPAHDGLWEAAHATRHDVQARLAVVPMVLEARGLDITPATVTRFENQGDMASAKILNRIYHDEIRHVWAGTRWFEYGCQAQNLDPAKSWQNLVSVYFRGSLKPPFNDSARESAGLTREYYAPLAQD
ncbi:ferritin-like domain-containing protein [Alterisphingorhabdus coralli]|uniref:Ferritin-like domain-containing protein n=1 Tax=Alterisphingorhabdus coralli TaxID=3071408 RepID=A0AA97F9K6_9SPHN|nr:ferritin-like domain-containing protein [Parasphingorhabdus sp. SCSIO 66989]WOE76041.1 ferritin-like domain-containing protein [Parasphingorhabdus sp. SCSIO 66989]